jgi:O-antigen/teichoic acid export membrane protein
MRESRIKKTIRNIQVSLVYYIITLLLNFFSRKIFIDYLGIELLGLNTTITNLLGFLNIAELGIGFAISYALYIPLYEKDKQNICEIVSIQAWLYQKIAFIITIGAIGLMCFFPIIFEKANLPMWYAYSTFSVLLFSSLLGYFINYRQIVLVADQKDYKITINVKGFSILKTFLQIIAIYYFTNGYVYWLALEFIMAIVISYSLHRLIKREYPWLIASAKQGNILRKKHPEIIIKTKQIFVHKIAGFVLNQTSPLIVYAFATLTLVAIYGNYLLMITGITVLSNALFNSITAGIGSLVAEGNKEKILAFFKQLASFRIWLASFFCFSFYKFSHPFIAIWIGEAYFLNQTQLLLLTVYLFIAQTRICDIFLNAYGLYKDLWAPVIEASLNVGLSIILGYFFGLNGIITGILISLFSIVIIWKPIFLFKNAFEISPQKYFILYVKYIAFIIFALMLVFCFNKLFISNIDSNSIKFLFLDTFVYFICSLLIFTLFDRKIWNLFLVIINKNSR